MASIYDFTVDDIHGKKVKLDRYRGKVMLIVNTASKCGFTPQYKGLEALYEKLHGKGLEILGFPCNQFLEQEPGTADEIQEFCSVNYGVTFPLFEKIEVNGDNKDGLYAELEETADVADGHTGDIQWNFEKFLVAPGGEVVARFRPTVEPEADEVVSAIEANLPS